MRKVRHCNMQAAILLKKIHLNIIKFMVFIIIKMNDKYPLSALRPILLLLLKN